MTKMESVITKSKVDINIDRHLILLIVIGFFLSRVNILDKLHPFGIAFLGAYIILKKARIGVLMAVSIGLFTTLGLKGFDYYIGAFLIYGFFTIYKENKKFTLLTSSIIVATLISATRIIGLYITDDFYIYDLILVAFEGVLVFTMTYVFSFSHPLAGKKEFTNEKMICSIITLALVLSGLTNLNVLDISIKNILILSLVLYLSYNKGILMGSTIGIILGMVSYISHVEMPFIIAILGIGGMLSGLFRDLGKSGSVLGFILGNGIISFYINGFGTSFLSYKEILIGSLLFLALYNKFESSFDYITATDNKVKNDYENRKFELASKRLTSMTELFESLAKTFRDTLEEKDVFSSSEIYTLIDDISINKCKKCDGYDKCWGEEYYSTYYSLFTTIGIMESNVEESQKLIKTVLDKCEDTEGLSTIVNTVYNKYREKEVINRRCIDQKMVLIEQLEGLSKIVDNINLDVYKNPTFNEELEELLIKEINNYRFDISELMVAQLDADNIEVYLEFETNNTLDRIEKVTEIVSNALGYSVATDFTYGSIENRNRFKLIRSNRYQSMTKVSSYANSENGISGDNFTFGDKDNISFAAISDGMGIGNKASFESNTAIEILEKMMDIDADKEMIIKTINTVLRAKSGDEMFATLDVSFIDMYSGRLQVIKSGAPPTFIKRKDEVIMINSLSLPIGILQDVDFNIYEENIEDGDIIIMMSDGVLEANTKNDNPETWMKKVISGLGSQSPQAVADEIMNIAKLTSHNEINDDMTILVTKVWRNI